MRRELFESTGDERFYYGSHRSHMRVQWECDVCHKLSDSKLDGENAFAGWASFTIRRAANQAPGFPGGSAHFCSTCFNIVRDALSEHGLDVFERLISSTIQVAKPAAAHGEEVK